MPVLHHIIFYLVCAAAGYATAVALATLGVTGEKQQAAVSSLATILVLSHGIAGTLIKSWGGFIAAEGVRTKARLQLRSIANSRRRAAFVRLVIGFAISIVLKLSSQLLIDEQKKQVVGWASAAFAAIIVSLVCLAVSLFDYWQFTEASARLADLAEQDKRRLSELNSHEKDAATT